MYEMRGKARGDGSGSAHSLGRLHCRASVLYSAGTDNYSNR